MLEKVEVAFRDLLASLQTAKLYTTAHPIFKKAVQKSFASLQDVLCQRQELVIGIVGEELAFEKEIFFDLSKAVKPAIQYLKSRGIERIVFMRDFSEEEYLKFIAFLAAPKEEITSTPEEYLSLSGVRNILAGKLRADGQAVPREVAASIGFLDMYASSLDKASQSVASVLNLEAVDHLSLKFSINNIIENLSVQYRDFLKFSSLKRYDVGTYVHLMNVSILSMFVSSRLGFSREDTLDIGVAALFHDLGKLYISRKIIRKAQKLTDEEFVRMKSHPILGAEILVGYADSLGPLPAIVAFEHHLKYNLSGYPKVRFAQRQHVSSSIVSVCDVYDALSERRGYKADYPPDMIYNLMMRERGDAFDPELVDKFFKIVGVWPIGSIVSLSDGSVAVVRDENEEDIFSPKVEVIFPQDLRGNIDLKETKGTLKIERYLNPWTEGKDYLKLIEEPPAPIAT